MKAFQSLVSLSLLCVGSVRAIMQNQTIAFTASDGALMLGDKSHGVMIHADAADWPGVLKAATDLATDFGKVTGINGSVMTTGSANANNFYSNASVIFNITGRTDWTVAGPHGQPGGHIIVGSISNSSLISDLVSCGKLDIKPVQGQWEAYTAQIVQDPMPGVPSALVIAGADKRGAIYGLYDISEQIGVSPWYYFADVPAKTHDAIYVTASKVQGSPSIKYRGFFINDEAPALTGWMNSKYPINQYGSSYGAVFYTNIFELLLRLRANYLWPAQWNGMFNVDDPRNQPGADEYGIVMGTSHTEPMDRSTKEWNVFGKGTWYWPTNNQSIYPFFVEGARRALPYENVITMGMRGSGDTALGATIQTQLLEDVVASQREILDDVYGDESRVPQMWCLYKEVQGYYEAGMTVPDDITLLWTDDNWGNIRRLPIGNETSRSGGAGVYYHFDYVGDPRDYKWINTINLEKTYEQMRIAYERQARTIWVVNVGDMKPLELPISHFLDLAYDMTVYGPNSTLPWLQAWAAREFGTEHADAIASVMDVYGMLANRRKYELVQTDTYSLINYQEADKVLAQWSSIASQAQTIYSQLSVATQAAFFEMVLHPVMAGYVFNDIQISSAKQNLYAQQGRNTANDLYEHVLMLGQMDHNLTVAYNSLLNGKWDHMMDQTHLGYQYWQQPMRQFLPPLMHVFDNERALIGDLGVSVEQSNASVPGDDRFHDLSSAQLTLPIQDPYGNGTFIDIYSTGLVPVQYNVSAAVPWVKLTTTHGTLTPRTNSSDVRVYVTLDWSLVPAGSNRTTLNITSSTDYGTQFQMPTVVLPYNHTVVPSSFTGGFVETQSYVSIEAPHYQSVTNPSTSVHYETITTYGRTLGGVSLQPVTAPSQSAPAGPALTYNFYTFTNTTTARPLNVTAILSPSLNMNPQRPLKWAVSIDDATPKTNQFVIETGSGNNPVGWNAAVADAAWKSVANFTVAAGAHTMKVWALEPGVVFQKFILDLGGVKPSYLGPPESKMV